jgi:uncharacterized protein YoxC
MAEVDRTAWAKEAQRIEKAMDHRRKTVARLQEEIKELDRKQTYLLRKISDDYSEEHG